MPFPFCDLFLPSLKVSLLPFTWCLWLGSPRSSILSSLILVSSCTFQKLWELRHLWQHDQKNVYLFKILEGKTLKESVVVALLFLSSTLLVFRRPPLESEEEEVGWWRWRQLSASNLILSWESTTNTYTGILHTFSQWFFIIITFQASSWDHALPTTSFMLTRR